MYISCASKCKRIDKKLDIYMIKINLKQTIVSGKKSLKHTIIRASKNCFT